MNATVQSLLVLQERDLRVIGLASELEELPRQQEAIEKDLARSTARFQEIKEQTRLIESDRKKLDLEVESKKTAIARYRSQQTQTRKNEEFAALNHEIAHAEKEIVALEDRELELMEAYEKGLATVAAGQAELTAQQEKAKMRTAELQKRVAAAKEALVGAREKQAEAQAAVPEEALNRYRRILKSKGDVAVVPLEGGSCSGCHMKVTTQTVLSAKSRQEDDHLTACEYCGRLVYWIE